MRAHLCMKFILHGWAGLPNPNLFIWRKAGIGLGRGLQGLFFRALLAALLKLNAAGEKRPNDGPSRIHVNANLAPEVGQQCLSSDKEVAKKGLGEGKGLHSRCIRPAVSSTTSSPTSAFHSHGNWFWSGILMVWIPTYQDVVRVNAPYLHGSSCTSFCLVSHKFPGIWTLFQQTGRVRVFPSLQITFQEVIAKSWINTQLSLSYSRQNDNIARIRKSEGLFSDVVLVIWLVLR